MKTYSLSPCTKCKKDQEEKNFSFRNRAKNIRHKHCKTCVKKDVNKHYKENIEQYIKRATDWNAENVNRRKQITKNSYAKIKGYPRCVCCSDYELNAFLGNCPEGYQVDHIKIRRRGGMHCLHNLQYLTISDHCRKSQTERRSYD